MGHSASIQSTSTGSQKVRAARLLINDMMKLSLDIAGDGVFSVREGPGIILVDLNAGTNKTLVSRSDIRDVRCRPYSTYAAC